MERKAIDRLIINSTYEEPQRYWSYNRETRTFSLIEGRRAMSSPRKAQRPSTIQASLSKIELANKIRPRVKAWREAGYPGVTGVTRRLLEHWYDPEEFENRRFFFCQREAIETLIWLTEAPAAEQTGISVSSDGGPFRRLCAKMATGSGKTIVMAMANRISAGQRRFGRPCSGAIDRRPYPRGNNRVGDHGANVGRALSLPGRRRPSASTW